MGLGTIYLLCFAGVVLFFISGDRGVHHPNNSLSDYLDSSRSHALSCINTRHMAGSATKRWLAVQHVMRYLQSTIDVLLTFNGSRNESVVDVYSDADCANGVSLKSVSDMVLRMYGNCVF